MTKSDDLSAPPPRHGTGPAVSVVVPAVRLDLHLRTALQSLLTQTLQDIEVVLVLDGVGDDGWDHPDDRVRVLRLPTRQGTPAALNAGLVASAAPYIARLDADDVAEPERLERQLGALTARPDLVGVGSAALLIDGDDAVIGELEVPTGPGMAAHLLRRNVFVHSAMLLDAAALRAVGGYDERCLRMQDYDLWLRLSRVGALENTSERLVRYRVHDGMHSRQTNPFGRSAQVVARSRRALAQSLGRSRSTQAARDLVWTAGQTARHLGLRRPGYASSITAGSDR
ncbi:glycosyltransferase [Microbacterium sp. M1A1_1b]